MTICDGAVLGDGPSSPADIGKYHVYRWHHIDDPSGMHDPEKFFGDTAKAQPFVEAARRRLSEGGWEGDGTIQLIWIPPFIDDSLGDCYGYYIWHVKQLNNGTSWLASPAPLQFPQLLEQQ